MNLLKITLPLEVALSHVNMDFCKWLCENEESRNIRFTARGKELNIIFREEDRNWVITNCAYFVRRYKDSKDTNKKWDLDGLKQLLTL